MNAPTTTPPGAPTSGDAAFDEALRHHQAGRLAEAADAYRAILQAQPGHADASHNLGVLTLASGAAAAALPHLKAALEGNPAQGQFWLSYIEALIRAGHAETAQHLLDEGRRRGLRGAQVDSLAAILRARPETAGDADAHYRLGNALRAQGRLGEAEASFRRAVALRPAFAEAAINLGSSLHALGRLEEAEAVCRRALEHAPERLELLGNLGNILRDLDRLDEAEACFRRALALHPQAEAHAFHASMLLPVFPDSPAAIDESRARFAAGVASLSAPAGVAGALDDPGGRVHLAAFYLAYHDRDDRSLMESVGRMFRARLPVLNATAPHLPSWQPPAARAERIRVGILSEYLSSHTVGKLCQGLIAQLDRGRFEVLAIHALAATAPDSLREAIDRLADRSVTLPPGLVAQQQAVAGLQLDVLFYPDIGMSPTTYFLAFARLAPVQAVGWGHPDTSGLDTLDYFVSADPIEPQGADAHYTERLIRLSRLPCFYQPLVAPNRIPDRAALGLPEEGTLYVCPQSLFKFHPDFDAVLADIAAGDPAGHILVLESHVAAWSALLRRRWAGRHPILLERVRFLPRLALDRFMALLAHADVLLDPLHFGSGNTLYEGMVYGTPVVSWPGRFMRGRIVAGAYRQMRVAGAPIAERIDDYAPLALALGRDPERRAALRRASTAAAGPGLYADRQVVREFESFFAAAVAAAARGERLPPGWRPEFQAKDRE